MNGVVIDSGGEMLTDEEEMPLLDERSTSSTNATSTSSLLDRCLSSKEAVIAVVSLALFVDMVLYDMVVPLLPTLLRRVDRDETYVGVLFAVYAVGFLLATPISGIWSDRHGDRKLPMILGQTGLAIATVIFAMTRSFGGLILARLLQGGAAAVSWTLGMALLADSVPPTELGSAMGTVFGFQTLGYFVGPLMGGVLTRLISLEAPFIVCSILCLIDLAARAGIRPPPPTPPTPTVTSLQTSPTTANTATTQATTIKELIAYPEIIGISSAVILTSASFSAVETLLSAHLQHVYGLDVMWVSFAMMSIIIPSVLFSFIAGRLSDRHDRYKLILASSTLYTLSTPFLGLAPNLPLFLIACAYFGATSSLLQAPALPETAAIVERLGGGSYAQVYAILNACYSVGMLVGPMVASFVNVRWGFSMTMYLIALPFPLLLIPFFAYLSRKSREGELPSMLHGQL